MKTKLFILILIILPKDILLSRVSFDSNMINSMEKPHSYYYEPMPMEGGKYVLQLGGSVTLLPVPVSENEYLVPSIDLQFKMGLCRQLSLVSSFYTNVFSNVLHAGIQYNTNFDRLSIGLVNHIGAFAGFMDIEGQFDWNTAFASFYLPMLRIGYRFDGFVFTLTTGASYIFYGNSKISENGTIGLGQDWNEYFFTLTLEQPFLKKSHISFGVSVFYDKSPYQCWLLYNTIDYQMFIPEFFFRFQL